ncbi:uncharacterized protein LOC144433021 [Glandiceps talaboti]
MSSPTAHPNYGGRAKDSESWETSIKSPMNFILYDTSKYSQMNGAADNPLGNTSKQPTSLKGNAHKPLFDIHKLRSNEFVIDLHNSRSNEVFVFDLRNSRLNKSVNYLPNSRSSEPVIGLHNVTGSSKKQGELFGYLQPHDHFVVPNIAHFIWFTCRPFRFENLISMLSVHRVMQADKMLFHTDCQPEGEWWQEAKNLIPPLIIHYMAMPTEVFGKKISTKWPEHAADFARLQILMRWGGVYFDLDLFVLASLDPLRYYDYVVGREYQSTMSNGIILANKNATFLKIFYNSYKHYNSKCWSCNSVSKQNKLAKENITLLHIEPDSMIKPAYGRYRQLFNGTYNWREGHFTVHVYMRLYRKANPNEPQFTKENIKTLDNAFGEMCRYIYYGSPGLIGSNDTTSKVISLNSTSRL